MCGRVDIGVEVVGCRVREIEEGGVLGVQNRKTEPPGFSVCLGCLNGDCGGGEDLLGGGGR